jgi:hypothetical protein
MEQLPARDRIGELIAQAMQADADSRAAIARAHERLRSAEATLQRSRDLRREVERQLMQAGSAQPVAA